jgi:hypothetical protein
MTEDKIQQEIFVYFSQNYPTGLFFAVPNGGSRNIIEAKRLKNTGVLAGVSDLILILPNSKVLFVEVKMPKGKQSEKQIKFEYKIQYLNHTYAVVRSLSDFIKLLSYWGY